MMFCLLDAVEGVSSIEYCHSLLLLRVSTSITASGIFSQYKFFLSGTVALFFFYGALLLLSAGWHESPAPFLKLATTHVPKFDGVPNIERQCMY